MTLAMNIGSKPKAFWKYVNSMVKTFPLLRNCVNLMVFLLTSLHPEMVNLFNNYFSSVCILILFQHLKLIVPLQSLIH